MKTKKVETGIYSHEHVTLESFVDLASTIKAGLAEHLAMQNPSVWLDSIEREATAAQANPVSDRQARDLAQILQLVSQVRGYLEAGDVARVTTYAIRLGMMVERAKVRRAEANAACGKKVRKGGRKGHMEVHGTPAVKDAIRQQMQTELNRLLEQGVQLTLARKSVAEKFGCHEKTVRRNTTPPRT